MNKYRTTIYHARVSIVKTLEDYSEKAPEKLSELFTRFVNEDKVSDIVKSDFDWHFGDVEDSKEYVYCKIGKIRRVREKTKFDHKNKTFLAVKSDDEDVFISHLLFDKKKHFLLFEERPEVGFKELIHVLTRSFKEMFNREISIDILPNKLEVNKILQGTHKITKARFLLRPSNPDNSQDLKMMDDLIRDVLAKRAKIEFANDEGLAKKSKPFSSALSLSNRGFGNFHLDYVSPEGKKHHFSSKQKKLKDTIPKPADHEWKKKLIDLLSKTVDLLNKK